MTRAPQVTLNVTIRMGFGHITTNTVMVDGSTPVANLWPAVVEAVRSQTVHDGSTIEKISLVSR